MTLGLPKSLRQSTPANSLYYDAEGNPSAGGPSPPISPRIEQHTTTQDAGVDVTRSDPPTTFQSPMTGNGFRRSSVVRDRDEPNTTMSQPQSPQNNQNKLNQPEIKAKETDDVESLGSVPIYYDESRGAFKTSGGAGVGPDFQKPTANGGENLTTPNKLSKNQTERSRNGGDRVGSRFSRLSARRSGIDANNQEQQTQISDATGAFAMGAAMSAPDIQIREDLDQGFQQRTSAAEGTLTRKQSSRIKKQEQTFSRKIARIIKVEAKTEQRALDAAIKELASIQKMQQEAVKEESRIQASHTKSLHALHSRELALITAQSDMERAQADMDAHLASVHIELNKLKAKAKSHYDRANADVDKARAEVKVQEDHREASKKHALETTELVKTKRKEVEVLRGWLGVDEREREVKLSELHA